MKYSFKVLLFILILVSAGYARKISLDGKWQFAVDTANVFTSENVFSTAKWRDADVPSSWQAQFEDLRDYQGVAWYKKEFELERFNNNEKVLIHFEAVDYLARIFVNGKEAGSHEGGYTPFELDITDLIKEGANELLVRVMDPVETEEGTDGISNFNIPHGKQNWYVQNSGIWRSAFLLIKPEHYIRQVHVSPSLTGNIEFDLLLSGLDGNQKLNVDILEPSGKIVASKEISPDRQSLHFSLSVKDPALWELNNPQLHKVNVTYGKDQYTTSFGFRSFEAKDGRLFLNGKLFYMIGALDQDFYPETIYSTPSEEYLRDEMRKAKELGLNTLRCHIKVPDPLYLKVADELGIVVWYEVPNWDIFSESAAVRGEKTIDEMLARDWNHPSLCVISIINESWGIDLSKADQRKWLKEAFDRTKKKFTNGLVVDNSACWGNFHIKTDINDYHTYYTIPENRKQFDKTIQDMAKRPDWLFSRHGDAEQSGKEPLMLSEFGNWGLPKLPAKLPWWFSRRFEDIEVSLPEGVYDRFKTFKYDEVFGTYEGLAEESQKAQFTALKYEIESLRLEREIQGYIITEFTDINWECNGLLDMWRNKKLYADDLYNIQREDVIIPRPVKYNYFDNDIIKVDLWISHYSDTDFTGSTLKWTAGNKSGSIKVPSIITGEVQKLESIRFIADKKNNPHPVRINFELTDTHGKKLAVNYSEIFLYPKTGDNLSEVIVYAPLKNVRGLKSESRLPSGPGVKGRTIVTNAVDNYVRSALAEGANVICIADSSTRMPANFPYKIFSRDSAWLDGNWASNMNWLKNHRQPFKGLVAGKQLGFQADECRPWRVIKNIPQQNYSDVLAGLYIGWVHLTSAYMVQMNAGSGKLLLCTIPALDNYNNDPFSRTLLNNMISYISGNDYKSSINWNVMERQ